MKVIDLLNKIANGEEVPKKIRVSCCEFEYNEELNTYFNIDKASPVKGLVQDWLYNTMRLNIEVEIIEDKEDINIQDIEEVKPDKYSEDGEPLYCFNNIVNKINEIQKAVKYLEKTKEDKKVK